MTTLTRTTAGLDPAGANHRYLRGHLRRLRLLLQRRVLWLRSRWAHDPLEGFRGMVVTDLEADVLLAEDDPEAEARFYREDPEARAIGDAAAALGRSLAADAARTRDAGEPPPLDVLGRLFGLSAFERDVLLLCLAPEMDSGFERLYAYLHDDAARGYPTPALALALFALPEEDMDWLAARRALGPTGQLRRHHLLADDGAAAVTAAASRPLRLDERVTAYLLGHNQIDDRAAEVLRPLVPGPLTPGQAELLDRLHRAIDGERHRIPWPMVNLVGPADAGKAAFAQALCERLGVRLLALDGARLAQRRLPLRLLEREAVLAQVAFYLELPGAEAVEEREARAALLEVVERLGAFLLVATLDPLTAERRTLRARVPRPTPGEQRALWTRALGGDVSERADGVGELVHQFDFGPAEIARSVAAATSAARLAAGNGNGAGEADGPALSFEMLWRACREQTGWRLEELAQRIDPAATWDDIVLPGDVLLQLRELAAQVSHRPHVYEAWGFETLLSRGRGITALFAGPSGTGKTMAAEVLARELSLDLFRVDLSGVVSKYIGETEKNLRRLFDAAEQSGAILFFDEADALFGKRSEVKDSHDRYANIEVNYLLQRMESYRGLAILATNMKSMLDQAFLRRLRFLVDFPFPDAALRRGIWERAFPPRAAVDGIDRAALARLEVTGGNIRNIALNAAFLAAAEAGPITMEHVVRAARREYAKIDKLVAESEFGPYFALGRT